MDVVGILVKKTKEASGVSKRTGREWRTADFLIEIPGRFAQKLIVQVRNTEGGRIAFFEKHIGMEVSVSFDFVAHEYEGNWYNQLDAWGIAPAKPAGNTAGTIAEAVGTVQTDGPEFQDNEGKPLPFI